MFVVYQETRAPNGFEADDSLYRFRVVADSNAVYYYTADLKTAEALHTEYLVINYDEYSKYQSTVYSGKQNVSTDAVFHIYDNANQLVTQFRWDAAGSAYIYDAAEIASPVSDLNCNADGTITIRNLEAGSYFFGKSAGDADGYHFSVADNSSITLKVIRKSPLSSGLVYDLYEKSGSGIAANDQICVLLRNADGSYALSSSDAAGAVSGITPRSNGEVIVTGLDATEGENYGTLLDDAIYNMYLVESDGSATKLYFRYDDAGRQYLVSGTSGSAVLTDSLVTGMTGSGTGMIEVNGLPYGTYFMQEIQAPVGYRLNAGKQYFRVSAATIDANGHLIFSDESPNTNETGDAGQDGAGEAGAVSPGTGSGRDTMTLGDQEVLSRIVLIKNDFRDTSQYLKGAWYRIYRMQPNTEESLTAEEYLAAAQAAATNAKGNTANADFVRYWGDTYIGQEQTDATGSATFSDMPFGTYLLCEYRAPIGYTWNNDADKWTTWTTRNKTRIASQIVVLSADTIRQNSDTRTLVGTDENGNEYTYAQTEYYAFYSNHLDDRQTGEARLLKSSTDNKPLTDGNFSLYQVNFTETEKKTAVVRHCGKTAQEANAMTSDQFDRLLEKVTLTDADVILTEHFENGKPRANLDTVIRQDTTPKLFSVHSGTVGTTIEVSMTNDKNYGEIWLYKQEKESTHKKLFGAQFALYTEQGEAVRAVPQLRLGGLARTGANGVNSKNRKEFLVTAVTVSDPTQIVFSVLDDDRTASPEGYAIAEDVIFTINAYNCDNQFLKCEDPAATAAIIVDKEIPDTAYFDAYDEPTFMFRICGLEETTGEYAVYTRNTTKYKKNGKDYTLAIHMSDTTGTAMVNVPVGQYLIEEMPVSRYACYGIEVVGSAEEQVRVRSASSDTRTSQLLFDRDKFETDSTAYTM